MPVTEKSRRRNGFCYRALAIGTGSVRAIMGSREGACYRELSEEEWALLQGTCNRDKFCKSYHGVGKVLITENSWRRNGFCYRVLRVGAGSV